MVAPQLNSLSSGCQTPGEQALFSQQQAAAKSVALNSITTGGKSHKRIYKKIYRGGDQVVPTLTTPYPNASSTQNCTSVQRDMAITGSQSQANAELDKLGSPATYTPAAATGGSRRRKSRKGRSRRSKSRKGRSRNSSRSRSSRSSRSRSSKKGRKSRSRRTKRTKRH